MSGTGGYRFSSDFLSLKYISFGEKCQPFAIDLSFSMRVINWQVIK